MAVLDEMKNLENQKKEFIRWSLITRREVR